MYSYQTRNITIDYTVEVLPKKQDITLLVDKENGVKLIVPRSLNESNLHFIMAKKAGWILEQLGGAAPAAASPDAETAVLKSEAVLPQTTELETGNPPLLRDNDKIPYLGRQYRLTIIKEDILEASLAFRAKFIATIPSSWSEQETNKQLQLLLTDWYINRAADKFRECAKNLAKQADNLPARIEAKDLQHEFSRNENGTVLLNWRLLMAPMATIQYVLATEIGAHAETLFQDAQSHQKWLEENELTIF